MLPFLKPRKLDSVVVAKMKPEGSMMDDHMEGEPNHALMAAAEDLIKAIHAKDATAVAEAIQAAHDICSMGYEHEEMGEE